MSPGNLGFRHYRGNFGAAAAVSGVVVNLDTGLSGPAGLWPVRLRTLLEADFQALKGLLEAFEEMLTGT